MSKVFCKHYGKEMDALKTQPFPGEAGKEVYKNISQQAWNDWTELQTKIINEHEIDLSDQYDRKVMLEQMLVFFKLREKKSSLLFDLETGDL